MLPRSACDTNASARTGLPLADEGEEIRAVAVWLADRVDEGLLPETIGVFVRSERALPRAVKAVE